ncbi:hypothetical protein A4R35_23490 [Thermogemmatispora tikiterensis]|uniref:Uncharacterized protein n=1 Tax=Thermogemmatispora tikiterensis TaxID=1825093 RepID=A0A328VLD7_9CHLR|nr:hypothetical protein A4R35_23490 [Thermogemmatispora tikiterensis]
MRKAGRQPDRLAAWLRKMRWAWAKADEPAAILRDGGEVGIIINRGVFGKFLLRKQSSHAKQI